MKFVQYDQDMTIVLYAKKSPIRPLSVHRLAPQLLDLGATHFPDHSTIMAIIRLAWSSCSGNLDRMNASAEELHEPFKTNSLLASTSKNVRVFN